MHKLTLTAVILTSALGLSSTAALARNPDRAVNHDLAHLERADAAVHRDLQWDRARLNGLDRKIATKPQTSTGLAADRAEQQRLDLRIARDQAKSTAFGQDIANDHQLKQSLDQNRALKRQTRVREHELHQVDHVIRRDDGRGMTVPANELTRQQALERTIARDTSAERQLNREIAADRRFNADRWF